MERRVVGGTAEGVRTWVEELYEVRWRRSEGRQSEGNQNERGQSESRSEVVRSERKGQVNQKEKYETRGENEKGANERVVRWKTSVVFRGDFLGGLLFFLSKCEG